MTWRVIKADPSHSFLTCDNPVFFDKENGLKPLSESSVSLCHLMLHYTAVGRVRVRAFFFVQARPLHVKEIDRRVAFVAERFVFYHHNASWVPRVADKLSPRLTPIEW